MKVLIKNPEQIIYFLEEYIEERFYKAFFKAFKETLDAMLSYNIKTVDNLTENDSVFLHFLPIYMTALNESKLTTDEVLNLVRTGFKTDNIEIVKAEFLDCIKPYLVAIDEAETICKVNIGLRSCNVQAASLDNVIYEFNDM